MWLLNRNKANISNEQQQWKYSESLETIAIYWVCLLFISSSFLSCWEQKTKGIVRALICVWNTGVAAAGGTHPGFKLLVQDVSLSHTVLFVGLHLLRDVLLCHLAEVVLLLRGLLEDFLLMLTDLSEMFQHFNLPTLIKRESGSVSRTWSSTPVTCII